MTEDFKDKILNWITSNYEVESGDNVPIFNQQQSVPNDLTYYVQILGEYRKVRGVLQLTNSKGELLENNIIYGDYKEFFTDTVYKSFIIITDGNFNYIQTILTYYGGTDLPTFQTLEIENGTVYGIYNTETKSNLLMFDISKDIENLGLFKVVFKKSYEISNAFYYGKIIKKPNEGEYIAVGEDTYLTILNIKINVGSDNEINVYTAINSFTKIFDIYTNWDGNFRVATTDGDSYYEYYLVSGVLTYYSKQFSLSIITSAKILDENYSYLMNISTSENHETDYLHIYKLNKINSTYNLLYEKIDFGFAFLLFYSVEGLFLTVNGEIFFKFYYSINSPENPLLTSYENFIGRIVNDVVYYHEISNSYILGEFVEFLFINKTYNLYRFTVIAGYDAIPILQIYNSQNYNGLEYQALNSMIPNSTILYDENGEIVYAKNLYNKTINNNTTTATVDIPNNFLNDVTVHTSELYGETNSKLISSTKEITKNIYESVLLNFVNTIVIKDINTVVPKIMNVASSDLNNSISNLIDYDNSRLSKYKINYSDDTFRTSPINLNAITYNSNSATYIISVYVPTDKSIKDIELISNDENISYLSIDCTNLENNKFYNITQKLEVE